MQSKAKQEAIYQQDLRNWRETRQGDMEARALDCRRDNAWWANLHTLQFLVKPEVNRDGRWKWKSY